MRSNIRRATSRGDQFSSRLSWARTVQASQMKPGHAMSGRVKPTLLPSRVVKGRPARTHPVWYVVSQGRTRTGGRTSCKTKPRVAKRQR